MVKTSTAVIAAVADFFRFQAKEVAALKMKLFIMTFTVLILSVFLLAAPGRISANDKYQEMINCDLHQGACTRNLAGSTVTLAVVPRPVKAMQDLLFQVRITGKVPSSTHLPYIDLGMPGMNMGPNRVQLKSTGTATYEGSGVIVRCRSGRRTWQARVTIPGVGQTDFIFDVVY
ncbi:MAG: hypothetical protein PVG96_00500 [Desulfobacterales bacterium]|jgi:hypothetical protein